ncbi:MAG: chemotaxis protein histidine kinase CheA, partial [Polaribacter sp.]
MSAYKNIEQKSHQFARKFYTNELIKGIILFFSLGLFYFFFTLFLEYFLWLKPTARTFLFWLFIVVEVFLFIKFILIPVAMLIGFRKGISLEDASKIIGNHFPEVQDKLLNILQLKGNEEQSDLILASIHKKSAELQPIPFVNAIDFTKNKKYLKYAVVPILIYLISLFTVSNDSLSQSLERVVNHRKAYNQPALFSFILLNSDLKVIQGKPITISLTTVGSVIPNEAKIVFNEQQYYLENNGNALFSYTFLDVQEAVNFYVESNGVQSQEYQIDLIGTPTINDVTLDLNYPKYLGRSNETIQNSGYLTVPEGTTITWRVKTTQTESVAFINNQKREWFTNGSDGSFVYDKKIINPLNYQITSSNKNLIDYENLQFSVDVVKDEFPMISVTSNIDSVSRGTAEFAGQISDDYGLRKLQLVYYKEDTPEKKQFYNLKISKQQIQTFFYQFPDGLNLQVGTNYELYFQVFDNDAVNGNKQAKSKVFSYRQKTADEVEEELLEEQRNTINDLENAIQNQEKQQEKLEDIQQELQNKKSINWNDKKKVESFVKRQEQYKKMMQRQTDKLQETLEEQEDVDETLKEKKEALKERIKELKKLDKQQKLLDEIQKLAEKLDKEELVQKAKELAQQNKQQQRSLEKTLEMIKRFYVEQKTMQIANKIEELSKKQESLVKKDADTLDAQKEIRNEFDAIKKELEELNKDNEKLKEPMELPDVDQEKEDIDKELKKSEESLENQDQKEAKKSQRQSSKKMQEMSAKMQQAMMDMQADSVEENMEDLRKILENLVIFSFQQESLMEKFSSTSTAHPDFGKDLKKQNEIKTYFEHIDDSLYVLAMRLPKISSKIQDDLSAVHYNLEQSLDNFSENRFSNGISNQRYVMTSTNNLADYLSEMLSSMKNSMSMKMGKGKKGKGEGFSLPDLIKKQEGLSEKMKDGLKKGGEKEGEKKGEKPGEKGEKGKEGTGGKDRENGKSGGEGEGPNDDLDGELYEIFKQQSQLRQELQNAIKES